MTAFKLQRSTWILFGTAIVLSGVVLATELGRLNAPDTPTTPLTEGQELFPVEEADIQAFQVTLAAETLEFEKVDADDWGLTAPVEQPANEGTIAFLLNLLATSTAQNAQTVQPEELAEFGLVDPLAVVTFRTTAGETFRLAIGDPNFDGSRRYAIAQTDLDGSLDLTELGEFAIDEETEVVLVPNTFASAANRPLADWEGLPPLAPEADDNGDRPTDANSDANPDENSDQDSEPEADTLDNE